MNRNNEAHFSNAPTLGAERSTFPFSQNIKTTFDLGQIIPFYVDMDVLPGDTWQVNWAGVIRLTTPIKPTMDNLYADIYFFAIPWRLTWEHTKQFFGENKAGAWAQQVEYTIPYMVTPSGGAAAKTYMDYLGIPTGVAGLEFSALALRALTLTYNEHFRDQNLIAPATEYTDDTTRTASNTTPELGGLPFKAARFHDALSSMLPDCQKGPAVTIPVGASSAPLNVTNANVYGDGTGLRIKAGNNAGNWTLSAYSNDGLYIGGGTGPFNTGDTLTGSAGNIGEDNKAFGIPTKAQLATDNLTTAGLIVDLSGVVTDLSSAFSATINAQRYAYATQRILEQMARGGSRYTEIIRGFYHVTSPDARQQRPEYLGGKRIPLNYQQTVQTSSTDATSPQSNLSAFSHTTDSDRMFTKSFTEHTIILGLIVCRQDHSYNQGLAPQWSRRRLLDVYNPKLAHIGEQAVKNKVWYAQGPSAINSDSGVAYDEETAGFQEAWWDYRMKMNMVTGEFRTNYAQSLKMWHMADEYSSMPVLSQAWLEEIPDYLDRTLTVSHSVSNQFLADMLVSGRATRVMPLYSIPGLIDHF